MIQQLQTESRWVLLEIVKQKKEMLQHEPQSVETGKDFGKL